MADGQLSNSRYLTPLMAEEERLDWIRLIRSRRVGAVTFYRLVAEHGSARAALDALPAVARAAGLESYDVCPVAVAQAEMDQARKAGARLLCFGDANYPTALLDISDAPPVLWAQGDIALLQRPMLALVGARNASSLGVRMARRLGEGLGQAGHVIVSGLARGIDTEAHKAAMATGTVAVQAGGVDVVYPTENTALAAEIAEKSCRISEHPCGLEPQTRHFPQRNRIVSGLSRAVIVVEAAARSGSLITAKAALDQGREVMAVPGHPFDARASGCNMLIRDGAVLVRGPADVLEVVGTLRPLTADQKSSAPHVRQVEPVVYVPDSDVPQRPLKDVALLHSMILSRLGPSPLAEDQLLRDLNLPAEKAAPELLMLELEGRISRHPGGLLSRLD